MTVPITLVVCSLDWELVDAVCLNVDEKDAADFQRLRDLTAPVVREHLSGGLRLHTCFFHGHGGLELVGALLHRVVADYPGQLTPRRVHEPAEAVAV